MTFLIALQRGTQKLDVLQYDVVDKDKAEVFAAIVARQMDADSFTVSSIADQVEGVISKSSLPAFDVPPLGI